MNKTALEIANDIIQRCQNPKYPPQWKEAESLAAEVIRLSEENENKYSHEYVEELRTTIHSMRVEANRLIDENGKILRELNATTAGREAAYLEIEKQTEALKDTERFAWNVIKLDPECFSIEVEYARLWLAKYGAKK